MIENVREGLALSECGRITVLSLDLRENHFPLAGKHAFLFIEIKSFPFRFVLLQKAAKFALFRQLLSSCTFSRFEFTASCLLCH